MNREDWLRERRGGIGGTDISAICGVSPYAGPLDVYLDKLGFLPPRPETPAMRLGTRLEPVIADLYTEETGKALRPSPLVRHRRDSWAIGTPDRLVVNEPRGVEIKTAGLRSARAWGDGDDEAPPHYLLQCQWYMAVTELPAWDLAVLIGGQDFRVYQLTADAELQAHLLEIAGRFWRDHVLTRTPPSPDASATWGDYLARTYLTHTEDLIVADADAEYWAEERRAASLLLSSAEERKTLADHQLKAIIGDRLGLRGEGWMVTWKKTKDRRIVDWDAFARACDRPDLLAICTSTQEGARRFLFTNEKGARNGKGK